MLAPGVQDRGDAMDPVELTVNLTDGGQIPGGWGRNGSYVFSNPGEEGSQAPATSGAEDHECVQFRFIFYTFVTGLPCILGVAGNVVSLVVLQRDNTNAAASFLLQALALADNAVLVLSFLTLSVFFGALPVHHLDIVQRSRAYVIVYVHPFAYMAQSATVWITVLLAVNRYVAVCRPLDAIRVCTLGKARLQVAAITVFSILYNFPRFFQWRVEVPPNGGIPTWNGTVIGDKTLFGILYFNALHTFLILILPLVLLIVLNYRLISQLRLMAHQRSTMTVINSQPQEENITLVMVIIIVIFIVCNTPDRILKIIKTISTGNTASCTHYVFYAYAVCNLLIIINSSTNFLVYYFFRKRFRRHMVRLLCPCCLSHENVEARDSIHSNGDLNQMALLTKHQESGGKRTSYSTLSGLSVNSTESR